MTDLINQALKMTYPCHADMAARDYAAECQQEDERQTRIDQIAEDLGKMTMSELEDLASHDDADLLQAIRWRAAERIEARNEAYRWWDL